MNRVRLCESGSPVLEMLLFTPLALMFLFVAVDAGVVLYDKAAMRNYLRSALNSLDKDYGGGNFLRVNRNQACCVLELSGPDLRQALENVADTVSVSAEQLGHNGTNGSADYRVKIAALDLQIDPNDGRVLNYSTIDQVVRPSLPPRGDIPELNSRFPYVTMSEFLDKHRATLQDATPSPYAIPVGAGYGLASSAAQARYHTRAVLLYAEVNGLALGINHGAVKSMLGRYYGFQDQQLFFVRRQIE